VYYLHLSVLLNNGLGLFIIAVCAWLHNIPPLADVTTVTKVCTAETDAIPAPLSLAQHWVRIGKHWWARQGIAGLKYEVE
jgi:hypothetical protein